MRVILKNHCFYYEFGGRDRGRTGDLIVANDALSQLSYSPSAYAPACVAINTHWDEEIISQRQFVRFRIGKRSHPWRNVPVNPALLNAKEITGISVFSRILPMDGYANPILLASSISLASRPSSSTRTIAPLVFAFSDSPLTPMPCGPLAFLSE